MCVCVCVLCMHVCVCTKLLSVCVLHSLFLIAQLLRQGHQLWHAEEDHHLLQEGHLPRWGDHLRLQVPHWRREDPLPLWGPQLSGHPQLSVIHICHTRRSCATCLHNCMYVRMYVCMYVLVCYPTMHLSPLRCPVQSSSVTLDTEGFILDCLISRMLPKWLLYTQSCSMMNNFILLAVQLFRPFQVVQCYATLIFLAFSFDECFYNLPYWQVFDIICIHVLGSFVCGVAVGLGGQIPALLR